MSPRAILDDTAKLIRAVREGGAVVVAVALTFIVGYQLWQATDSRARPDPYTGSDARAAAALQGARDAAQDAQGDRVEAAIERLARTIEGHAALSTHAGTAALFAGMTSDLKHLSERVDALTRALERQGLQSNGGGAAAVDK